MLRRSAVTALLTAALLASSAETSSSNRGALLSALRGVAETLAGETLEAAAAWDKPLGRAVLKSASLLVLRPSAHAIAALRRLHLTPEVEPLELFSGPLSSLNANVTLMHVSGLESLSAFPALSADGPQVVETTSTFRSLDTHVGLQTRFAGPLGWTLEQPLVLAATLENVSLTLRFRCAPKRGALAATGARFDKLVALDRSALQLELESVRVRIDGDILVSVESAAEPEDEHSSSPAASSGASPSMLWRLFSKALSSTLRELVEEQAALAIHETLQVMLEDAMRGGGLPHAAEGEREAELDELQAEAQAVPDLDHDVTPAVEVVAAGQECDS